MIKKNLINGLKIYFVFNDGYCSTALAHQSFKTISLWRHYHFGKARIELGISIINSTLWCLVISTLSLLTEFQKIWMQITMNYLWCQYALIRNAFLWKPQLYLTKALKEYLLWKLQFSFLESFSPRSLLHGRIAFVCNV